MADVYISYSRLDAERVKPIAERLQSLGYELWWDKSLTGHRAAFDQREREIGAARVVIVIWSDNARNAPVVHAEAAAALDAGKLLALKIDSVELPPPLNAATAFDATGAGDWGSFEQALAQWLRGAQTPVAPSIDLGPMPVIAVAGAPKLVTISILAVLAAYSGALRAAFDGVMAPEQLEVAVLGVLAVAAACSVLSGLRMLATLRADG